MDEIKGLLENIKELKEEIKKLNDDKIKYEDNIADGPRHSYEKYYEKLDQMNSVDKKIKEKEKTATDLQNKVNNLVSTNKINLDEINLNKINLTPTAEINYNNATTNATTNTNTNTITDATTPSTNSTNNINNNDDDNNNNFDAMTNPEAYASQETDSTNSATTKTNGFEKFLKFISTNLIKQPLFGLVSNNSLKKIAFVLTTLAVLAAIRPIYSINDTHKLFEFYCVSFWFIGIAVMLFIIDPYDITNAEHAFKNKTTTFGGIGNEVSDTIGEAIVTVSF